MSNPRSGWLRRRRRLDRRIAQAVQMAYEHGTPIPEEFARLAAAAGLREGMTVYGIGLGNRGAHAEAERWLQRACEQEDPVAMIALGTMHMDLGDLDKAEEYYSAARSHGHPGGAHGLRLITDKRAAASIPPLTSPAPATPPPAAPATPLPVAASADAAIPERPPAPWQAPPTSPAASAGRPSDADAIAQWLTGPAALGDPDAQAALELLRDPDDDSAR